MIFICNQTKPPLNSWCSLTVFVFLEAFFLHLLTLEFTSVSYTLFWCPHLISIEIWNCTHFQSQKLYWPLDPHKDAIFSHREMSWGSGGSAFLLLLPKCNVSSCLISRFSAQFSLFVHREKHFQHCFLFTITQLQPSRLLHPLSYFQVHAVWIIEA